MVKIELRGKTNAFSIGGNSVVLNVPKEIAKELEIDTETKKTFFDIYTEKDEKGLKIIYVFSGHALKRRDL